MKYVIIAVIILVVAALFYGGYYMFRSVFDSHVKGEANTDPSFVDSEKDMMRPTMQKKIIMPHL